jgi:hypothetical protein
MVFGGRPNRKHVTGARGPEALAESLGNETPTTQRRENRSDPNDGPLGMAMVEADWSYADLAKREFGLEGGRGQSDTPIHEIHKRFA